MVAETPSLDDAEWHEKRRQKAKGKPSTDEQDTFKLGLGTMNFIAGTMGGTKSFQSSHSSGENVHSFYCDILPT
jgi:hypothetical protein